MTGKIFRSLLLVGLSVLLLCSCLFLFCQYSAGKKDVYAQLAKSADSIGQGLTQLGPAYLSSLSGQDRITWIAADGAVLYDSQADPSAGETYSGQEDVRQALAQGYSQGVHISSPTCVTMYYAARLANGTILRLSRVRNWSILLLWPIFLGLLLVLALSVVLSLRLAKQIIRPISDLATDTAEADAAYKELDPLVHRLHEQNSTIRTQMDELTQRQKEFSVITGNMTEGFLLLDRQGNVLGGNQSARSLVFGGSNAAGGSLLASKGAPEARQAAAAALEGQRTEKLITVDGRTWQLIANPVTAKGRITGAVLLLMDVTEREQREQLRREFSANVSHELKTPLTSISGFAELMWEGMVPPDKAKEFAGDIHRESQRMIALVDDIIRLSQLDENAAPETASPVPLKALAAQVLSGLQPVAESQQISLSLTGEEAVVSGIQHILWEMVYNLCDNAIKYNRPGGYVQVAVTKEEKEVLLSVKDNGIGIPYADQSRVFERFFRVDKSHSREIGGTGLGLSIVKHGALYHNARVELQSQPGAGTTITLCFPQA